MSKNKQSKQLDEDDIIFFNIRDTFLNIENYIVHGIAYKSVIDIIKSGGSLTLKRTALIVLLTKLPMIYKKIVFSKELENFSDYEPSDFNKLLEKLMKKARPLIFTFNMALLTLGGVHDYQYSREPVDSQVSLENTTDLLTDELSNPEISIEEAVDIILEGAEQNQLLTEEEFYNIEVLEPFLLENPYLDYEKAYKRLSTVDVYYRESKQKETERVGADYYRKNNTIRVYNDYEITKTLPHEYMHALGSIGIEFLNEGMVSILVSEYLENGFITNAYGPEIYMTEIIIELVSKETVLRAFSLEKDEIIVQKLVENPNCKSGYRLLTYMQNYTDTLKGYYNATIDEDTLIESFTTIYEEIENYLDGTTLDDSTKNYIRSLLYQTLDSNLVVIPKINYNQSLIEGYSEYLESNEDEAYSKSLVLE